MSLAPDLGLPETRPVAVVTVTSLRERGSHAVEVRLDGAPWRVVPLECAAEARLSVGVVLDRERARTLRRALRRTEAVAGAVRTLRSADQSRASLDERLARRGVAVPEREEALRLLERAGLVDDARLALTRAETLARRGLGDAAIRDDLERRGLDHSAVSDALATLEPETVRAARVVVECGQAVTSARLLARRGFADDVIEEAIASLGPEGLG